MFRMLGISFSSESPHSYFFGYDIALTPLVVSYPIEIWPYKLRAKGLALVQMTSLTFTFFNTFVTAMEDMVCSESHSETTCS